MLVTYPFVHSRLDYCNSLFRSLFKFNLHRLQSIQNSAARIVTNSSKYTRITPVLGKLHWLTIQFCSEFKLATLVYKFIHTGFPKFLVSHLSTYCTTYNTSHRVLQISSMYQNFNRKFTSLLSSLASVLPLMLPLFGIHFLKTFTHQPLLPLLERSSKPISMQSISSLAHFLLWLLCGADLFLSIDFLTWTLLLCCCDLESTTQWRLSTINVKLELERHLTVSEIQPGQDFIGQGHYGKVKSRLHHDVAHLHPQPMSLPSINFLHLMMS